jgi:large subunit ribosomal protein L24e
MVKCDFCGEEIERGTGMMFVKDDGKIYHFCSSKCENNTLKLGRKPRQTRWTQEFRDFNMKRAKEKVKKDD